MSFGQVIADRRKRAGLSQRDLAEKIRKDTGEPISPQYLNDIEHDRRGAPSPFLMKQLAKVLGLPVEYLQVVAGQLPEDLRRESEEPDRVRKALKAYRRALGSSR